MTDIPVLNGSGALQTITVNANGQALMAASKPVVIASDQSAVPVSGTVGVSGSVAVTGTFYQATQPVSIASMPSTPVTGTFWQATQPVSLASQPLPPDAATETTLANLGTKLDTLHTDNTSSGVTPGTAGTASTDVLTVQGPGVAGSPLLVHARQGSQIYSGDTVLTPKFAKVAASTSGVSTAIAAVTGKKLRVLGMLLTGNGAVNVNLQSHTTTTTATGLQYIAAAGGGAVLPPSAFGWFETVAGEALDINLSGAVAVGGQITYVEV